MALLGQAGLGDLHLTGTWLQGGLCGPDLRAEAGVRAPALSFYLPWGL